MAKKIAALVKRIVIDEINIFLYSFRLLTCIKARSNLPVEKVNKIDIVAT